MPQGDRDIVAGRNDWLLLKFNFERIQRFQEKQPISPCLLITEPMVIYGS